jgi:poly-beta-1,6-N-acetyl-D-glucosamine synthase
MRSVTSSGDCVMLELILMLSFWLLVGVVFYTYAGYPIALWAVSHILTKPVMKKAIQPSVTIVLAAFNEAKFMEQKLKNLLELHYSKDRLEILIGSDGASDETDRIVGQFQSEKIRFFRFVKNLGKAHVLNALVHEAQGDILVMTDTRQRFDPDAIQMLVRNFADPKVGCVSGELHFEAGSATRTSSGMGSYWNYEKFLRRKESDIGSMLGATGAIYAIRRNLYPTVPPGTLVDDMFIPLAIIQKGHRAVFEPQAKAYDQPSEEGAQEFKRKVRTLAGNYQIFSNFPELLIPGKSPIGLQLVSHKLLRLLIPFCLMGIFVINLALAKNPMFLIFLQIQIAFYAFSLLEAIHERWMSRRNRKGSRRLGIGYLPYTFCLLNYSALVGLYGYVTGRQKSNWEKAYA